MERLIKPKTILITAGLDYVYDPEIAFVTMERVAREGKKYAISETITGDLLCRYSSGEGKIFFNTVLNPGEKVSVIIKT